MLIIKDVRNYKQIKRNFLSLVFAAGMLLGTATMTSANDWDCIGVYVYCDPGTMPSMALVCGDSPDEMYHQWQEWQDILC